MEPRVGHTAHTRDTAHHPGEYLARGPDSARRMDGSDGQLRDLRPRQSGSAQRRPDRIASRSNPVVNVTLYRLVTYLPSSGPMQPTPYDTPVGDPAPRSPKREG